MADNPPSADDPAQTSTTTTTGPDMNPNTSTIPISSITTNGIPLIDPTNTIPMMTDFSQMTMPLQPLDFAPTMAPLAFTDPSTIPGTDPVQPPMSADEIALYDRQIRLWGMQAQEKIRNANILLIGMRALGNEIAKNLVLSGVGVLTICDHEVVTEDDLGSQFLLSEEHMGQNRAQAAESALKKLNPRVQVYSDPDHILTKLPAYFSSFGITIATGLPLDSMSTINMSCRMFGGKFYAADVHGMYGYIFADLILHDFVIEKQRGTKVTKAGDIETATRTVVSVSIKRENDKVLEVVTKQEIYSPLLLANSSPLPVDVSKTIRTKKRVSPLISCLRALFEFQRETNGRLPGANRVDLEHFTRLAHEKHLELQLPHETLTSSFLRSFLQNLGSEISPVTAFLGGHLAQDVINVLGQREQPLQNFLLFDGEEFKGPIYSLHPIFDDNLAAVPMDTNGLTTMPNAVNDLSSTTNGVMPPVQNGISTHS